MASSAFVYIFSDAKRDQVSDLMYTVKVIRSYYELSFHQWELSLLSVGNRLMEIDDPGERLAYANRALEVYQKELLAFGLADTSGQVLTFTGRRLNDTLPDLRSSEDTRRSFDLTLERDGITLGESYYFENVADWILPIRVPIRNDQNEIIAVNTSAIDYSSLVSELAAFGFNETYLIHLKNIDFNTTQLYYPLASDQYKNVLGSDKLDYQNIDTVGVTDGIHMMVGKHPLTGSDCMIVCTDLNPFNHRLIITVPGSSVYGLIFERFKIGLIVYLILLISSFILYWYLRKNLKTSLSKVRTEQANLKSIFESTSSVIGLFDRKKQLLEFNSAFNDYSVMTDDLPLHKNMDLLKQIKHQESAAVFSKFMDRALNGEKFQEVISYPGSQGELTFRFTYNPVYDEEEVVGFAFFAEDITEIRSYQQQLEEYNKGLEQKVFERTQELGRKNRELEEGYQKLQTTQQQLIRAEKMASLGILSAGIGHEINNPLNFIKHGAISLKEQLESVPNKKDYDQYFEVIEEGVKRASAIVMGLSHFSRTGEAMDESCDLHQVLDNSLTLLTNRLKSKNIEIIKSYDADPFVIPGNEGKLHQVFTNIIKNAEQAIFDKGVIRIVSSNRKDRVVIEISDTGTGIDQSLLQKVTDPFFTTKGPGEGTGLGLFICQMIIDDHDAQLEITSEKGRGTTFVLSFKAT
ncbi:MAG: ATP-binding protein [Cytophagales bacterium]|nr:ATP-binding protein [Cytophagales bacterium]